MTTSPVTDHPSCPPEHGPAVPWTRVEKARIFLGYWAFRALEAVVHLLRDMTAGRINLFWTTGNDGRATWSRLGMEYRPLVLGPVAK